MTGQNYINHIALVLDASESMRPLAAEVVKVADGQIRHLARRSTELDQETRVTVYTFDYPENIRCVFYDKDVLRMPSLAGLYRPQGATALVDATLRALDDLRQTPELYGDHAFLAYVLTDGEENRSARRPAELAHRIGQLAENWTLAAFVPSQEGVFEAKRFGFPAANIAVWDATTARGMAEAGEVIRRTTESFMQARATGVRGSRNLFDLGQAVAKVDVRAARARLQSLHPGQYRMLDVKDVGRIDEFVEARTRRAYRLGEAFYELSKPERVQAGKAIALLDRRSRAVYTGPEARAMLQLPAAEVKVAPASHPDFDIFIQSTSVNRKLMPNTRLLLIST